MFPKPGDHKNGGFGRHPAPRTEEKDAGREPAGTTTVATGSKSGSSGTAGNAIPNIAGDAQSGSAGDTATESAGDAPSGSADDTPSDTAGDIPSRPAN